MSFGHPDKEARRLLSGNRSLEEDEGAADHTPLRRQSQVGEDQHTLVITDNVPSSLQVQPPRPQLSRGMRRSLARLTDLLANEARRLLSGSDSPEKDEEATLTPLRRPTKVTYSTCCY